MSRAWSATRAAAAWLAAEHKAFMQSSPTDDDCRRIARTCLARAYLEGVRQCGLRAHPGAFLAAERTRLAAPTAGAKGKRK